MTSSAHSGYVLSALNPCFDFSVFSPIFIYFVPVVLSELCAVTVP